MPDYKALARVEARQLPSGPCVNRPNGEQGAAWRAP